MNDSAIKDTLYVLRLLDTLPHDDSWTVYQGSCSAVFEYTETGDEYISLVVVFVDACYQDVQLTFDPGSEDTPGKDVLENLARVGALALAIHRHFSE